jgi:hypothetical protein
LLTPANTTTQRFIPSVFNMPKNGLIDFNTVPRALKGQLQAAIEEYAKYTGKERAKRAAAASKAFKQAWKEHGKEQGIKIKGDFLTVGFNHSSVHKG